jgi:hypothetical protein
VKCDARVLYLLFAQPRETALLAHDATAPRKYIASHYHWQRGMESASELKPACCAEWLLVVQQERRPRNTPNRR